MRSEEAAWRKQFAEEKKEREAREAAWREQQAREEALLVEERRKREAEKAAWRQQVEQEEKQRAAEEAARRTAYEAERKQAERRLDRAIHRMIGEGDERFGRLMEALTDGDLIPLLQRAGFEVRGEPARRRAVLRDGMPLAEMDLIAYGRSVSVGVEVKTTLRPEYVKHFARKMERFRELFPEYAAGAVHGAMAYLTATESAPLMAVRRGLLLIRVMGSSASIVSPPGFEPRNF